MILPPPTETSDGRAPPASGNDDPAAGVLPSFREALGSRTWLLSLAGPVSALAGFGTWYITYLIFERSYHGDLAQGDEPGLRALMAGTWPATVAAASGMFIAFTGLVAKSNRIAFGGVYVGLAVGTVSWLAGTPLQFLAFLATPLCGVSICWMAGVKRPWKPGLVCSAIGAFVALATSLIPHVSIAAVLTRPSWIVDGFRAALFILVSPYLGTWAFFFTLRRGVFSWPGLDPDSRKSESKSASSGKR